jgi:hypothetical protein
MHASKNTNTINSHIRQMHLEHVYAGSGYWVIVKPPGIQCEINFRESVMR